MSISKHKEEVGDKKKHFYNFPRFVSGHQSCASITD